MASRVAHVGTGNVGRLALTELVTNPQFQLTGLCVSSPEEVCKDAGALAGVDVSSGVDPGFINDLTPFALASTCQRIEQVRCMEIAHYATYDGAEVMHYMGFGQPLDDIPMLLPPGILSIAWGTAIRQLAAGLGIEVDEITESYHREPAPEDFDIAVGHVAKGTLAALQFEIRGMVKGHPAIVIEHITRLRPDLRPDWQQPASGGGADRVEITREPSY